MPRAHHHPQPRRGRLLQLAAAASGLLLLALLVLLPAAPPEEHTTAPASLLRAAIAAHPLPASYARPCADHLALSLHRLRAALSSLESGDVPAALHLASASLQCQYDCSHLLSLPAFRSHPLTSRFLDSLAPQTLNAALKPPSSAPAAAFPARIHPDATVCKPNSGVEPCGYSTVQAAVDAAPNYTAGHFVIVVAAGTYKENVVIPYEKTNIYADGGGAGECRVPWASGYPVHNAAVLPQVPYYRELGTVDFIFGNAAAVFEECVIKTVPWSEGDQKRARNVVAASGRIDPGQTTGFVFVNCTVDGNKEFVELFRTKPQSYRLYLGRPWKEYARTLYVSCYLGKVVRPEGWLPWRGDLLSRHSIMENLTVEALVQTTQQGLSGAVRHQNSM
ncbi:unnamed protein product [Miscanthus lutarioriparius]|uniref:Pectinesterase catalytic domain-containing protein n=1 Tax=Miscanthus lutarioriparius TaxID=422564 RepID=A0A811R2L1_9POAL|nr:unnamed protein product [Miscanthus lutarioriparius]